MKRSKKTKRPVRRVRYRKKLFTRAQLRKKLGKRKAARVWAKHAKALGGQALRSGVSAGASALAAAVVALLLKGVW